MQNISKNIQNLSCKISKNQLQQDFVELKVATKIAEKYKINIYSIYKLAEYYNINPYVRITRKNLISKENLEDLYAKTKSIKQIAKYLNVNTRTLQKYFVKYNINYKKQKKYNYDVDFFSKETELSFYFAGFIAADGCLKISKGKCKRYQLQISLANKDIDILEKFKKALNATSKIKNYIVKNSLINSKWKDTQACTINIYSKKICCDLEKFNIIPRKSLIYKFPEWLTGHPLCHHFIRGYVDGDGSYFSRLNLNRKTPQMFFALRGTQNCLINIRNIFESKCNLIHREKDIRISNGIGILEYGGNIVVSKIVNYLYNSCTIFLNRKHNTIKHLLIY